MPFPNFAGKQREDAFFTPEEYVAYLRREGLLPQIAMPAGVILCYRRGLLRRIGEREPLERVRGLPAEFSLLSETGGTVAICGGFGIGAPAVTAVVEELIALGVRRFVSIGTAGALQPESTLGEIIVCDRAIRDEGVSHHYLPPERYAHAAPALSARLQAELARLGGALSTGATWTIDAPYRETTAEARYYQQEGVRAIDMEAAALFAVAAYRGVELAAAFVVSDSLADLVWQPSLRGPEVQAGLDRLYQAARATLSGIRSDAEGL